MQVTTLDDDLKDTEILDESSTPNEGERDGQETEHGGEGGDGSEGQNDGSKEEKEAEESSGERP
jgi:hypothetical protein